MGPKTYISWGPDHPRGRGNFLEGVVAAHCKVYGHSTVSCAKTAEPIAMLSGINTRVSSRNHVLKGARDHFTGRGSFDGCPPHKRIIQ